MRYASLVRRLDAPASYAWDVHVTGMDGGQFASGPLEHGGVSLLPGSAFGESPRGHVRLSLRAPLEVLDEACRRLRRCDEALVSARAPGR